MARLLFLVREGKRMQSLVLGTQQEMSPEEGEEYGHGPQNGRAIGPKITTKKKCFVTSKWIYTAVAVVVKQPVTIIR